MLTKATYDQLITYFCLVVRKPLPQSSDIRVEVIKRYLPEETEILDFIYETFKEFDTLVKQFNVLKYKIDLYFTNNKIAIECDEHGHKDREQEYEIRRENDINKQLNCRFIRFNPHDADFKLSSLTSKIIIMLFNSEAS